MQYTEWMSLPEDEQEQGCQRLDPYEDEDVFKWVKNAFLGEYGNTADIGPVQCGLGPFIGPYNCIMVNMKERRAKSDFPEVFLGFPVIVEYT